jgi:hypothetical protein
MFTTPSRALAAALALSFTLALPALADTTHPAHHHRPRHRRLSALGPVQPFTAPAGPASADASAPVPNPGITPPVDTADQSASLAPAVMQIHYPPQGDGYTSGSSAQAMDDHDAAKVTGLELRMPIGQ